MNTEYLDNMIGNSEIAKNTKADRAIIINSCINNNIEEVKEDKTDSFSKCLAEIKDKQFLNIEDKDGISALENENIKDNAIYIIEEIGGNPIETFEKLKEYKKKNRGYLPRLNNPSNILYVGSSTTGVIHRIKQHLSCKKDVYALHLQCWFEGCYKITILEYDDISREILQLIEDNLSCCLKPAFGKLGGNGR